MPANAPRLATLGLSAALTLSACGGGGPSGPLARDDTARTTPGTAVSILVLANDVASRGQPSLDTFDTRGDNGTVVRDERGTPDNRRDDRLVYTPDGGFTGVDRFTYRIVDDRGRSDEATVTVTVTDSGVALDDVFNVERDSSDNRLDVLANDSESMRVVALDTADAQPGSRIVIAEDGGAVSYTPPAGYTGADIFRYTAERTVDGNTERDEAEVQVNVQEPPPASNACREDIVARLDAGLGYCYDAKLTTTAGIVIDFTVFVPHPDALRANAEATTGAPLAADEPGFAPLLIHGHGYGGSKYGDFSDPQTFLDSHIAKLAWEAGYFVITFSERGFGQSGGQIGVMSPRKEGFDFVELVNWANVHLREHFGFDARDSDNVAFDAGTASHTDPDAAPDPAWGRSLLQTDSLTRVTAFDAGVPEGDIALATIGYSYGGGFQFNAQSVDPRVDAMIPMGTWFDLRYSLHPNDTPKSTWITLLTTFTVEGGNGEDPPPVIVDANSEAFGANRDSNDQPHNKARQVSIRNLRKLSPNGPVAYCDGGENLDPDPGFVPINDATESEGEAPPVPPNAVTERAARAHLLMVQGYGDTLFNFNEGYDNARCFESQGAPGLDVRYLAETSGHPLPPPAGPPQYAGSNTSMYLDEIVHCGTAADGAPRRYTMREVGLAWFDYHLRGLLPADTNGDGLRNADDIFPRACIVQVNTDTRLRLKTGDDNPAFSGTNTEATAFEWPREGAVFDSIAAIPRGCAGAAMDCAPIAIDTADGVQGAQGTNGFVVTGPDPSQQNPGQFLPLYTAADSRVMAGLPLVDWQVTRSNPAQDEIFYVGIGIRRCHANSADGDGSGTDCEAGNAPKLLHFQVSPVRVFPTAAADAQALTSTGTAPFPADDPRNALPVGPYYPLRWGANPGFAGSSDTLRGRLIGVSARLHPGDQVGLLFYGEHPVYKSVSSAGPGQVSIVGTVELPLLAPSPAPTQVPDYVERLN